MQPARGEVNSTFCPADGGVGSGMIREPPGFAAHGGRNIHVIVAVIISRVGNHGAVG